MRLFTISSIVVTMFLGAMQVARADELTLVPTSSAALSDGVGENATEQRIVVTFTLPASLSGKTIDLAEVRFKVSPVEELVEGYQLALIPLKVHAPSVVNWASVTDESESCLELTAAEVGKVTPQTTREGSLNVTQVLQKWADDKVTTLSFIVFPASAKSKEFDLDDVSPGNKLELTIYFTQD